MARTRKDAKLCFPAAPGSRRFYGAQKFTPEQVRQDDASRITPSRCALGDAPGAKVQGGQSPPVARRGAPTAAAFVCAGPTPLQALPNSRTHYRQPAYLLCTELSVPAIELIQIYVDRWQIEVNHRDERKSSGSDKHSVERELGWPSPQLSCRLLQPAAAAGLLEFALNARTIRQAARWRKHTPRRASILDMLTKLRADLESTPLADFGFDEIAENLIRVAYG